MALVFFSFFLLLLTVQSQLQEEITVQCYSSAADCTSSTNGVSLAAIDCCNRTGGGYISHSSLAAQCGACVVVGFDQSRVHIGPSDAGTRYSFTADVLLSTPGAPTNEVRDLSFNISQQPEMLFNVGDYLKTPVFRGQNFATLPTNFNLQYVSRGNAVALQPTLSFNYSIELSANERIPSGVVLVYKRLSITIDDIDTMPVRLHVCSFLAEGVTAQVYIKREKIDFLTPFEVTLLYKKYRDLRSSNQAALGDFDNFNFSKQSVLFDPVHDKNIILKPVSLIVPVDNVVELSEVFLMRISVTSTRVKITSATTHPFIVDSGDVFRIGIKDINISVMEGGTPILTIQQIGDERGGEAIGGLPESKIQPIVLRHEGGNATRGGLQSDFSFNSTVPKLTYNVNNTLNDITFTPVTSIDDNIIEGNETIRVIILPAGGDASNDYNVQVVFKWQTATITIIDNDTGVLSLERGTYDVIENEGTVEICAVLTGGVLPTDTEITIRARDNTARFMSDYNTLGIRPLLPALANRTCSRFNIINNLISEQLFENFTVEISSVFPENSRLTIDQTPSFIRIQDDDQAEVRFAMGQATFSEGGGNQSITVILGGGQLSQSEDVEVYIDDRTTNGTSLGFVTFGTGAIPQNRTVVFPVIDNNIALEPDKHYLLRLRNIVNIGLGNPGTMNVTVEDDDVVNLFLERRSYDVIENQSSVNICVVLTGGILSTPVNIYLFDSQGTAKYQFDYIFFNFHVILPPYKNSTCATLYIVNDNIKETIYEEMSMYILRVIPWNKNLHVDYTSSKVWIQDDDS